MVTITHKAKAILAIIVFFAITILLLNYNCYLDSYKRKKNKDKKTKHIDGFIDYFRNTTNGANKTPTEEENEIWETEIPPFQYETIFSSNYASTDDSTDIKYPYIPVAKSTKNTEATGSKKSRPTVEGFKEGDIGDDINKVFRDMKNGFEQMGNFFSNFDSIIYDNTVKPMANFFEETANQMLNELENVFEPVITFVENMKQNIETVKQRIKLLEHSFALLGTALEQTFSILGKTIETEMDDVGQILSGGMTCAGHFASNFRQCMIYWVMDGIGEILYSIFVLFPVWLIDAISGVNLSDIVNELFGYLDVIDEIINDLFNFSVFHYPDIIIERCYECRSVNFDDLVKKINYDNNTTIPGWMNDMKKNYDVAGDEFKWVFSNRNKPD